jgi:hypothetical protein
MMQQAVSSVHPWSTNYCPGSANFVILSALWLTEYGPQASCTEAEPDFSISVYPIRYQFVGFKRGRQDS